MMTHSNATPLSTTLVSMLYACYGTNTRTCVLSISAHPIEDAGNVSCRNYSAGLIPRSQVSHWRFGSLIQQCKCLFQFLLLSLMILAVTACGSHIYHFVEPGETLYSVSWAYGHDYREVARWNRITSPYVINRGQRLRVVPPVTAAKTVTKNLHPKPSDNKYNNNNRVSARSGLHKETIREADKNKAANPPNSVNARGDLTVSHSLGTRQGVSQGKAVSYPIKSKGFTWQWPTKRGKVIQTFDARDPRKKGVDVAGAPGQPIYSAASGHVVYSGGGLTRYGKLIIVKHNETYLSAYAHNKRLLVKEGDVLKSGQLIAEMGSTGTTNTKLHFEIRRNGKPVDPLRYLPRIMQ